MEESVIQAPRLYGRMFDSVEYKNLGRGYTDTLLIIGHGDGYEINDPVEVVDIRKTIADLGADSSSPVLRALLEAYYAGARDIWLCLAAPMDEYVPLQSDRFDDLFDGKNFYEQFHSRLTATYELLVGWEIPSIVVVPDAPLFGSGDTDFVSPLANFCQEKFDLTSSMQIGVIGASLEELNDEIINEITNDDRLTSLGNAGKWVMPVIGDCILNTIEIPNTYTICPVASVAGKLSSSPWDRGFAYARIPSVIKPSLKDLTKSQIKSLANAKLNPIIRTTRSKRGQVGYTVLATDNTLAEDGSDFWSIAQVRLVSKCNENIKILGNRNLATIGFETFSSDVTKFMSELVLTGVIRDFKIDIRKVVNRRSDLSGHKYSGFAIGADVTLSISPFFGIRDIEFTARVGPGA